MIRTVRAAVVAAVVLCGAVVVPGTAAAQTPSPTCSVTWVGPASGAWERAASWDTGRVPVAADTVCLTADTAVKVNASTAVDGLVVGSAQVAAAPGVTLTVTKAFSVTGGTLAGPGTVRIGVGDRPTCCTGDATITGPAFLVRGVQFTLAPVSFTLDGRLGLSGGSVFTNGGQAILLDGAEVTDDDGDPANAYVQSAPAHGFGLAASGRVRVDVATTIDGGVVSSGFDADLALPRLTNESSDGVLRGVSFEVYGRIGVPMPVTGLVDAVVSPANGVYAISTGGPALGPTLRSATRSVVNEWVNGDAMVFAQPLAFRQSSVAIWQLVTASARSITLADGSHLFLEYNATLRLRAGAGTLTVRPDTAAGPSSVSLGYGLLDGSCDQRGGTLSSSGAHIRGDWTMGTGASATLSVGRYRRGPPPAALTVSGAVSLAGSLTVVFSSLSDRPPLNVGVRIVTAAGGVTGTFAHVTLPAGYSLSYDSTGVVMTRTA